MAGTGTSSANLVKKEKAEQEECQQRLWTPDEIEKASRMLGRLLRWNATKISDKQGWVSLQKLKQQPEFENVDEALIYETVAQSTSRRGKRFELAKDGMCIRAAYRPGEDEDEKQRQWRHKGAKRAKRSANKVFFN